MAFHTQERRHKICTFLEELDYCLKWPLKVGEKATVNLGRGPPDLPPEHAKARAPSPFVVKDREPCWYRKMRSSSIQ